MIMHYADAAEVIIEAGLVDRPGNNLRHGRGFSRTKPGLLRRKSVQVLLTNS